MRQVIARAPTRLDFVGGWTDVQPFCDDEPGLVVNGAFGLYAVVRVTETRKQDPVRDRFADAARKRFGLQDVSVEISSEAPVGSGLGGSGAVGVALVSALAQYAHRDLTRTELAELAHRIELEDLGVLGGKQDQYAAAFGGFLALTFHGAHVAVEPIALAEKRVRELRARSVITYTGQARVSGDIHARVQDAYKRRARETLDALATIRRVARQFRAELQNGSVDALGELLNENWEAQKRLHAATTNARVDELFRLASQHGALGGKALGAGGGGCLYFLAREGSTARLKRALEKAGMQILSAGFDFAGVECKTADVEEA